MTAQTTMRPLSATSTPSAGFWTAITESSACAAHAPAQRELHASMHVLLDYDAATMVLGILQRRCVPCAAEC